MHNAVPFHRVALERDADRRVIRGFLILNADSILTRLRHQPRFWGVRLLACALAGPLSQLRITGRRWDDVTAHDWEYWPDDMAVIKLVFRELSIYERARQERMLDRERERVDAWLDWRLTQHRIEALAEALLERGRLNSTEARDIEAAQTIRLNLRS
jgi:hypothetical protein